MVAKFKKNEKKRFGKQGLFWILLLIMSVGLMAVLVVANMRMNEKRTQYISRIEILREKIQKVEKKAEELRKGVSQAGSKEHLERVAREQLGLKNPGEEVVVISKEEEESSAEVSEDEEEKKSFWNPEEWWKWLKGDR